MKKKILFMSLTMLLVGNCGIQAQNKSDEITVTDAKGKKEVIELPEAMVANSDSLMELYYAKRYLSEDSNCNMPDVNPVFAKEVYINRLSRIPSIIEMPYNEVVQQFIDRYTGKVRHSVSYMLGAQNFYMPIFEQALEAYGMPLELKYLPVIESALNPNAVSRVGATGLWQFMLKTSKRYDLTVNTLVDERRDPIKASYAAAHYLSDLYKQYGDWNLVIAAYNCGPEQIAKAIRRSKGERDYWKIYPYLPKETRGYVPAFIAANYIMTYYCEHNICPMKTQIPEKTDTIMVNRNINFAQIAAVCGISLDQLRALNPQYRRDIVNGGTVQSSICMPQEFINKFIDKEDSVYKYKSEDIQEKRTEVEINNEVPEIESHHSSYSRHRSHSTHRSGRSSRRSSRKRQRSKSITISEGQTLSEIAEKHHTTVKKLKKLNKISGSSIRSGKKLKIK
jgi:membrane-bound lytic murein transglycosylase D